MKKKFLYLTVFCIGWVNAQNVGINTQDPKSTLDIVGAPTTATLPDGIIAPRITLAQLNAKTSYGTNQTGAIVYVTDAAGATTTPTSQVITKGYYYFDGTVWKSLEPKAGSVIFTASLGTGNGGNTAATIAAGAFNTVPLPNVTKNIGNGTWNSTANTYTVPVNGTYLIKSTVRLTDGSAQRNIFQAVHTSNVDTPEGIWQTNYTLQTGTKRWTMLYKRVAYFNKGDVLRLYIYSDGEQATLSDASLNIALISTN
ncbi:hypothetical protein CO230_00765 [Chryseobacterium sp. 6424]|uniref:hypothetical protein n=1 Tax=Chryseobacterium sp. 6424 TaxID=2039166 RepID=UPI000EFBF040|nr:hypothetical protein [Chryseobacterium sp. 6424]AYO56798.1 hypothetical protein CO230_00765 [Chryseobacterium sp. 6424]